MRVGKNAARPRGKLSLDVPDRKVYLRVEAVDKFDGKQRRRVRPPQPTKRLVAMFLEAAKRKNDERKRYERTVPDEKSPEDMSTT